MRPGLLLAGVGLAWLMSPWAAAAGTESAPREEPATLDTMQAHYAQGQAYLKSGRYPEARAEFERVTTLKAPPGLPAPLPVPAPPAGAAAPSADEPPLYRLQAGDQIQVTVYKVPELTKEVIVRPDGRISYPLIGELSVEGLTLLALRDRLRDSLTAYVRDPSLDIALLRISQRHIIVLGEVNAPGVYRFPGSTLSLAEVIGLARGPTTRAHLKSVMITSGNRYKPEDVRRVNFHAFLRNHHRGDTPPIPGGSLVYVPRTFIGTINQFVDDVAGPGYRLGIATTEGYTTNTLLSD